MKIIIKDDLFPKIEDLMVLYEDVGWIAYTRDQEILKRSVDHSLRVYTAWYENKLIALLRIVGDGHTIIYIQDILVLEAYQGQGIGSKLLELVLEDYRGVRQIVLMTDDSEKTSNFYKKNGLVDSMDYGTRAFVIYR